MRQFLRSFVACLDRDRSTIQRIDALQSKFAHLSDDQLRVVAVRTRDSPQFMAAAAVASSRILGQDMHDVQLRGALAIARALYGRRRRPQRRTYFVWENEGQWKMTAPQSGLKAHRMKSLFILLIQRLSEFPEPLQILRQLRASWGCTRRMYIVEANFDVPEQLRTKLTCDL